MPGVKIAPPVTLTEAIKGIEGLIQDFRWARNDPSVPEWNDLHILRWVAKELRSRQPGAAGELLQLLTAEVDAAVSTKVGGHIDPNRLVKIAEIVVARWPVLSRALEQSGN